MSFYELPDHLVAQIADHLDYPDICNLMETTKRNYNIIKSYKKDKIKLYTLNFFKYYYQERINMHAIEYSNEDRFLFKNWDELEENVDKVKRVLDKCSSIDKLELGLDVFETELFDVLMNTKAKIGALHFRWECYFTMEEKLQLARKINVEFTFFEVVPDANILSDEFLSKILPRSTILNWSRDVILSIDNPMPTTDVTLNNLTGGSKVQGTFTIGKTHNSITVKGIVKVIKTLIDRNEETELNWRLGILHPNQAADANRYFGADGEMKGICYVGVTEETDHVYYYVSFIEDDISGNKCQISFDVAFP